MKTLGRVALWAGSLFLSVTLFSLLISRGGWVFAIFRVTMLFAFPVWCLYLPLIVALEDAEERRIWALLLSGTLIGPAALLLWTFILQLRGIGLRTIWQGDPLAGGGAGSSMIFALIVGFMTSAFYVIGLKMSYWLSTIGKAR